MTAPLLALAIGGGGGVSYISLGALDLLDGLAIRPRGERTGEARGRGDGKVCRPSA